MVETENNLIFGGLGWGGITRVILIDNLAFGSALAVVVIFCRSWRFGSVATPEYQLREEICLPNSLLGHGKRLVENLDVSHAYFKKNIKCLKKRHGNSSC